MSSLPKMQTLSPTDNDPITLQEQFQMKSLIMAKWAHELKNIFLAISSLIQNQHDFNFFPDNSEGLKMSQITSQHSTKFLSSLCDFGMYLILDITTLNTNNEAIKERQETLNEFNLSEALDFCIAMFQSKQKFDPMKKNVNIKSQYNFPLNKTIKCINENRFKQVIINLLSNSYKFTLNGEICLMCNAQSNDKIRVLICDTGIGMTQEEQEKLFKPYNIIEQNKEINSHGSGLGLYIVKEILTSFGTNINLKSKKNFGTEFWFDLIEKADNNNSNKPNGSDVNMNISQNAIDPNTIITDSLKNLILDINAGKKDDMIWMNSIIEKDNNFAFLNGEQEVEVTTVNNKSNCNSNNNSNNNKKKGSSSNMVLNRLLSLNNKSHRNGEEKNNNIINSNRNSNHNMQIIASIDKSHPSSSKCNITNQDSEYNCFPSLKINSNNNQQDLNHNTNPNNNNNNDSCNRLNPKIVIHHPDENETNPLKDSRIEYGRYYSQFPQHLRSNHLFSKKTKKYNIFICDDEQITAISTKNLLLKYFMSEINFTLKPEMYIIPNGIECLYKAYQFLLDENPVNLILIDQNMPFINGIEVCNLMKNMTEMSNIKVYLVTSEDGQKTKKNTKADGYFSKPITKNNIKEILKNDKMY